MPSKKSAKKELLQIIIVVIAAFLFYKGLGVALQTPMPILSVVSDSMEPTLHVGDLIVAGKTDYKLGDIAVYNNGRITIVHRIIRKENGGFIFKGDNNPVHDPQIVPEERVLGKVYLAVPLLGYPRLSLYWIEAWWEQFSAHLKGEG